MTNAALGLRDNDEHARYQSERLGTGVVPLIEERFGAQPGAAVLDLGPPTDRKLQFFGRLRARIFFNNTPDSLCAQLHGSRPQKDLSDAELSKILPAADVKFDLILAWDYLDYLSPENLRVVSSGLARFSRPGTWVYFFMAQHGKIPQQPATIDLLSSEYIRYASGPATREGARYPPKVLEGLLRGFAINKLVLLKNGIQEHLFAYEADR